MKQCVQALDIERQCFKNIMSQFPQFSDAKLEKRIFDGPKIQKILKDGIGH